MDQILDSAEPASVPGKRPILVPVDFSPCSRATLLFASHFAGCVQAPLLVLHVVHDPNHKPGLYKNNHGQGTLRPFEDIAADMLAEFIEDVRHDDSASQTLASAQTLLVKGLPARRIAEIAQKEDAALIVMGTNGRSRLSRLASGSVAAEVMTRSPIPVTVVKVPATGSKDLATISSTQWWNRQVKPGDSGHRHDMAV